jgi:hypothetical protein
MPLRCIVNGTAVRCHAKCKSTQQQCRNPAAWGCSTCKYHGARRPSTILRGEEHPNYRHGEETLEAKAERSASSARLRELEAMMYILNMTDAPRWRGRKPKSR